MATKQPTRRPPARKSKFSPTPSKSTPAEQPEVAIPANLTPSEVVRRVTPDHPEFARLQLEREDIKASWDALAQYAKWVSQLADKVVAGLDADGSLDDEAATHALALLEAAGDCAPALRGLEGDAYGVQPVDAAAKYALRTLPRD
jgi:hypothetical protein